MSAKTQKCKQNRRLPYEPVDLDRPFKLGSTIPIKFLLKDAMGGPIATAQVTLRLQHYSNDLPQGDPIDVTPTDASDSGSVFRYDGNAQYHYNLTTMGLPAGSWMLQAVMDDGTIRTIFVMIKDK